MCSNNTQGPAQCLPLLDNILAINTAQGRVSAKASYPSEVSPHLHLQPLLPGQNPGYPSSLPLASALGRAGSVINSA